MKHRILYLLVSVSLLAAVAWSTGCGDEANRQGPTGPASPTKTQTVPVPIQGPADDVVQGFLDAWNNVYAANVQGVDFTYAGSIGSARTRQNLIDEVTDPATAYAPSGWADDPSSMTAQLLQDQTYDAAAYEAYVSGLVQVGQVYYRLDWQIAGGPTFQSICVFTPSGQPVFGNTYSLTLFDSLGKSGLTRDSTTEACSDFDTTVSLKGYWVWPISSQRGEASVTVHVECDCEDETCVTTDEDFTDIVEDMQLGSANTNAEFITDEHGNREAIIGLSLSTATADVEIEIDAENAKVNFSASGLGSSLKREYNVDADCEGTCPQTDVQQLRNLEPLGGHF